MLSENKKMYRIKKYFIFSLATLCLACSPLAWSITSLSDDDLGGVTAQDGATLIFTKSSALTATQMSWQDENVSGSALASKQLQLNALSLSSLSASLDMDIGGSTTTDTPMVSMNMVIKPFLFSAGSACVAGSGSAVACASTSSFGEMALRTNNNTTLSYYSTRGLLDGTATAPVAAAKLSFDLSNAEYYMAQSLNSQRDLVLLTNLYLKGALTGSVSAGLTTGLRLQGDLSLPRISSAISGFNMDLAVNPNIAAGTYTAAGSSPLLHLGISGTMAGIDWRIIGGGSEDVITGAVAGDNGLKISMTGQLKTSDFEFEIGEGDAAGYSVRFKNFVSLLNGNAASPSNGAFDFGKLYLNVIPSGTALADFRTGFGSISQTADSFGVALRDFELVDYPTTVELYRYSDSATISMNPAGTMLLPLYDLDANLMLMPGGHPALAAASRRGIGFNLKAAFTGTNAGGSGAGFTGDKISGLLLADTSSGVGQYIGYRNINGFLKWQQGQLFALDPTTDGATGLRLTSASNVQINLSGQFALDFLPDGTAARKIKTTGHLFGLAVQLQSSNTTISVMPSPSGSGYLAITGSLNLVAGTNSGVSGGVGLCSGGATSTGSCIAITEPADGSQVQLATISGKLNLTDSRIDVGQDASATPGLGGTIQRGYVSFANTIQFDPGTTAADINRIGDINFLGGSTLTSYRLGEVVIPGGELYTKIDLRQR